MPRNNPWRRGRVVGAAVLATCMLLGAALASSSAARSNPTTTKLGDLAAPSVEGVRILLTNDDGVQPTAPLDPDTTVGLFELRKALCDAGAEVVVVAPWLDRSGASASITFGSAATRFTLDRPALAEPYQDDCGGGADYAVFGACVIPAGADPECAPDAVPLTPADATTLGVHVVQELFGWASGPHLIISGINRGGNDGLNVNISGTVGAATIGASLGIPSIAVSASSSGVPRAYEATAAWMVGFVGTLAANDLLPDGYILNVNHPRVDRDPVTDALWTTVAQFSPFATGYLRDGDTLSFQSVFAFCTEGPRCGPAEAGSDTSTLAAGKISVGAVSVNRTVSVGADIDRVRTLVMTGAFNDEPMTADDCKDGQWRDLGFANQGDCVRHFGG